MPAPTPNRGGRPLSLSRIAQQAARADGVQWLESLRRDAALGDATAIRILIDLALQAPTRHRDPPGFQ